MRLREARSADGVGSCCNVTALGDLAVQTPKALLLARSKTPKALLIARFETPKALANFSPG
ncbi:MAG TPA: hypothetical protein VK868_05510, partial [Pyrinomonadaceae bacterium]|nr:hypothetical protein [Pyrinomonadaceae bacterium]